MGDLTSWLMSMVEPLLKRGLASLGLGWLTFEGIGNLLESVRDHVLGSWSGVAPTVYDILALSGFLDAIGIVLGAMAVIASLASMSRLGKILA